MKKSFTVIILGSHTYIKKFSEYLKTDYKNGMLLIADVTQTSKTILPEFSQYLQITPNTGFEELSNYCKKNHLLVKAVINMCDYFETLHGQLTDYFSVTGPTKAAVESLSNKVNMHKTMVESGLDFFRPKTILTNFSQIEFSLSSVQFPIVVKTSEGAKSRGVFLIKSIDEFKAAKPRIKELVREKGSNSLLIEEFIYGSQVTPVMYVNSQGKVTILALVDVVTGRELNQDHMQLVYRSTPSNKKDFVRQKIMYVMQKIVNAAKLKSVLLHPEFFVVKDKVYLIEVNVRVGGFRSKIMKSAYNIDLDLLIWQVANNITPKDEVAEVKSCTVCEVWEQSSGIIKSVLVPKSKNIDYLKQRIEVGEKYVAPPLEHKPILYFVVTSDSDSLKVAKSIRSKIKVTFTS